MGSGLNIPSMFPPWSGVPGGWAKDYDELTAFDDVIHLIQATRFVNALGTWPGDPRQRWAWCHGWVFITPQHHIHYWDSLLGDNLDMIFADWTASYGGIIFIGAPGFHISPY